MNRTKLFGASKCFLANRDNFFPYEQALTLYNVVTCSDLSIRMATVTLR